MASPAVLEGHLDTVAGGARHVVCEHTFVAGKPVDEGGLPGVGPPDDAHSDAPVVAVVAVGVLGIVMGEQRGQRVGEASDAAAVHGRGRDRLTEAERVELRGGDGLVQPVGLVGGEDDRLAAASQPVRDALVRPGQAGSGIEHQDQHIRFLDRERGLVGDELRDRVSVTGQATGIDHHDIASLNARVAVATVASQPRQVRDERVPRAGEGVEQGRLADVRAADESNR